MAADGWFPQWFAGDWFPPVWFAPADDEHLTAAERRQEPVGSPATTRHAPSRRKLQGIVRRNPRLEEATHNARRQADEDVLILLA